MKVRKYPEAVSLLKWSLISLVIGGLIGGIGSLFAHTLSWAGKLRVEIPSLLYFLPLSGLLVVFLYQKWGRKDKGTNQVLLAVKGEDEIPFSSAPLIFIGTTLTHLFGASAGREGAALQLGGSIAGKIGTLFHMKKEDNSLLVMCGMSAAFAALFGTPLAAAVFSLEVASVGMMYYGSLLPCVLAAVTAAKVAAALGVHAEAFPVHGIPEFTVREAGKTVVLVLVCTLAGILFCLILKWIGKVYDRWLKNKYFRVLAASIVIIFLTLLLGTTDYMGAGAELILRAVEEGQARPLDFFWKMVLTAFTMKAGFKGGEIVPSLAIGATLGCVLGQALNFTPSLAAACGMTAVFCSVTNAPMTSLLISFELFGFEGMLFYLIATAVSFAASGNYSLYKVQSFPYEKRNIEKELEKR